MRSEQEVRNAIELVLEDEVIKHLAIDFDDSLVTVIIENEGLDVSREKVLSRNIAKIVKLDSGFKGLKLSIEKKIVERESSTTKYITVTSGKGGVGKSSVSANLAVSLARLGKKVGIIDADIYGPSLPQIFGINEPTITMNEKQKIVPMSTVDGVYIISTDFLTEDDLPLMWRGPMLGRMLGHFFNDVVWDDDFDFIIVDLPPGTGDIPLDLKNFIPDAKAIVVTTPNKMASNIAIKSGMMAKHLGHDILGVVENMSYYLNPATNSEDKIFGSGGGNFVATSLETELLAEIPISQVKEGYDSGIFAIHEENGMVYLGLANKLLKKLQ